MKKGKLNKMSKLIQFTVNYFLMVIFFFVVGSLSAQNKTFSQLKEKYKEYIDKDNGDSALLMAHEMKNLAITTEGEKEYYTEILVALAGSYYALDNLDSTQFYCLKALEMLKQLNKNNTELYASALTNLGNVYIDLAEYDKVTPLYEEAADIYLKLFGDQHPDYAQGLNNLGSLKYYEGLYKESLSYYEKSTKIYRTIYGEFHSDVAMSFNNLGTLYSVIGDYKSSLINYQKSMEIYKSMVGDMHPDFAMCLSNIGALYFDTGDYKKAETFYLKALEIRKKVLGERHPDFAGTLVNLGALYHSTGEFKASETTYKQAEKIIKLTLGVSHPEFAMCNINLGSLYSELGDQKSTEMHYKKALEIYKDVLGEKHPIYARCIDNLGSLYSEMQDLKTAEKYYLKSSEIFKESLGIDHPDYATSLLNLGDLYVEKGQYKLAESMYINASEIYEKTFGKMHTDFALCKKNLAILSEKSGDFSKAEEYYREALDIRKAVLGEDHPNYLSTAKEFAMLLGKNKKVHDAFIILNDMFSRTSKSITNNFEWLNDNQKESYWKQESVFFDQLSWFADYSHHKVPEVVGLNFNASLISKSKLLEAKISSENYYREVDELREELAYRRRLITKMESDGSEDTEKLETIRTEADALDKRLTLSWPEYAQQKKNLSITWEQVQQNLEKEEAAIEFVRYQNEDDSLYYYNALLLRKTVKNPQLIRLCKEEDLKKVQSFSGFYPLVWEPLEKYLNGINRIYYSPVGELNKVPFHAIYKSSGVEEEKKSDKEDNKRGSVNKTIQVVEKNVEFLIDRYSLYQLTSTRYLAMNLKQKASETIGNFIALVGGINYDYLPGSTENDSDQKKNKNTKRSSQSATGRLSYLEGTKKETDQINTTVLAQNWKTKVFEKNEATEEQILKFENKEAPSILHLATHGYAFPEFDFKDSTISKNSLRYSFRYSQNPMVRSGLILTGGNWAWTGSDTLSKLGMEQNGILTALEVSQLNLRKTKLVVLSACETGLGKIEGTEGTFGLKRGFKLAGVEQIIVSLWSVPDKETMELMTLFYTDLTKTKNPVTSFEKAQKEMRNKYPTEPEKWAGFVLVR